jgi:hypothetical protein
MYRVYIYHSTRSKLKPLSSFQYRHSELEKSTLKTRSSAKMHLLSLSSATVLGLVTFTHLAVGATLQGRDSGNQVNIYSNGDCGQSNAASYETTWYGPHDWPQEQKPPFPKPLYVGSALVMDGDGNFDSLTVNGKTIVEGNAQCPGSSEPSVWSDASGNACYVIGMMVNSALLYTQEC